MLFHKISVGILALSLLTGAALPVNASHVHHNRHIKTYRLIDFSPKYHRTWYARSSRHGHKAALNEKYSRHESLSQEHLADLKIDILKAPQMFGLSNKQAMYIFTHNQSYAQVTAYIAKMSHRSEASVNMSIHHLINRLMALP